MGKLVDELLRRWDYLSWRWHRFLRQRASPEWIIYSLVLGVALALGLFASIAATRGSSEPTANVSSREGLALAPGEAVTETITVNGKAKRVIRYRTKRGDVVYATVSGSGRTIALPGRTLLERRTQTATRTVTRTVTQTATEVAVVTETLPVTVTIVETVTETVPP